MKSPPLLCTVSVAIALLAPPSSAQTPSPKVAPTSSSKPAPAANTAMTDKARQLFEEGVRAAAAERWDDAHASFLAAWTLKEHYQIASNLGVAELKLGRYRDAAEHLTWYLHEAPSTKVQERQSAVVSLKEALAKVASITVTVVPQEAEVTVDGAPVKREPTALQIFLDPGEHEISAKLDGYVPAKRVVAAKAGGTEVVELRLKPTPVAAPVVVQVNSMSEAERASRKKVRTAVLVGGGAAAGAGVVAGVVFTVLANGKASDAKAPLRELTTAKVDCADSPTEEPSKSQCNKLDTARDAQVLFSNVAFWSFVSAGTVGIGTLVYGLVTRHSSEPERRVQVTPFVGPGSAGIVVGGAL